MKQESSEKPFIPTHQQRSLSVDKDIFKKEQADRDKRLRMDFALTFGTPEGKRVLKWVMNQCGWGKSVIGGNPALGLDVDRGTLYNSSRLGVYSEIRLLVPHEILKQTEFDNIDELLQ